MKFTPTMTRRLIHFSVAVAALAVLLGMTGPVQAQNTYTWKVTNGSFQNAANWNPVGGPPGILDDANYDTAGTFSSTIDGDTTVSRLFIQNGAVSFAMNGHTFNAGTVFFTGQHGASSLSLSDGTMFTFSNGQWAGFSQSFSLTLDRATFNSAVQIDLGVGSGSVINATVRNSSSFLSGPGSRIGDIGTTTLTVDGSGSSFSMGASSFIGYSAGSGTIIVQNGGALRTTGALVLENLANSNATITLTNTGSAWTHTDGFVTTGAGAAANINVNAGTTMSVTGTSAAAGITLGNHATLTDAGTVNVSGVGNSGIIVGNGGTLTINTLGSVTTQNLTRGTTGNINVTGGTLTINGGTLDNGSDGFNQLTGGTLQLQNSATTANVTYLATGSATATPGMVKVLSGATFAVSNVVDIGVTSGGTGSVVIDGAGSTLSSTSSSGTVLLVGALSGTTTGTLTVQNGGRYFHTSASASASIASGALTTGTVTVTGTGSRFDVGGLQLGGSGHATLNVTAGAAATSVYSTIAEFSGSVATATVSGAGSTWTASNGLYIGGDQATGGNGSLIVSGGGAVSVIGETRLSNNGTLTINSGALTTGSFTNKGTLNLQNGTLTVDASIADITTGVFNNSSQDLDIEGVAANTLATLQLVNGASTSGIGNLSIGNYRPGALVLASGANIAVTGITTAISSTSNSSISLTGPNTVLTATGSIALGGSSAGASTLTIGAGSTVSAGSALVLNASGTVNLNGGTLTMASFNANGGAFNWPNGTVMYGGGATVDGTQLSAFLGTSGALTAGHTLGNTSGTMTLTGNLTVAGGKVNAVGLTNSAALTVSSGSVQSSGLTNNGLLAVSGGAVTTGLFTNYGQIQLTSAAATITSTGTLYNTGLIAVTAGSITSASNFTNLGEVQLASPGATAGLAGTTLNNYGRLDGTGRISSDLVNNANGMIAVDAGQRLVFGGFNNSNNSNGTISLTGGTVEFTTPLTNAAGGFISGRGIFRGNTSNTQLSPINPTSDYGLKNTGVVAFSGGFSDVFGKVNNQSAGAGGGGGQIINAGGGTVTFHDDVVHNGQEIRTVAGSRTVFFGAVSGASPYTGTGTVEFDGDLRPGNSPAAVSFGGDLELGYSSRLQIELGGTTPGSQYDQVHVAHQLNLGGTLDAVLYNGFKPVAGNSFDIMDWSSLGGTFAAVKLPTMNGRIVWDSSQLYTTGALAVVATYYAGDINRDGIVTVADISALMTALADVSKYRSDKSLTDPTLFKDVADVNGDTRVDNLDIQSLISIVASNAVTGASAGNVVGSQTIAVGAPPVTAVPEPATIVLFGLGAFAIGFRRRSK